MKQLYHIGADSTRFIYETKLAKLYQIIATEEIWINEKSFSDISISELIREAKVARVSFYRNYKSKEDVLLTLIEDVLEQFRDTIDSNETNYYTYQNIRRSFEFFSEYGDFVLDLYQFGYGSILLEKLNRFHEEVAGTMPNKSIEKYKLYMYMGAMFNTAIMWIQNGKKKVWKTLQICFAVCVGFHVRNNEYDIVLNL